MEVIHGTEIIGGQLLWTNRVLLYEFTIHCKISSHFESYCRTKRFPRNFGLQTTTSLMQNSIYIGKLPKNFIQASREIRTTVEFYYAKFIICFEGYYETKPNPQRKTFHKLSSCTCVKPPGIRYFVSIVKN